LVSAVALIIGRNLKTTVADFTYTDWLWIKLALVCAGAFVYGFLKRY